MTTHTCTNCNHTSSLPIDIAWEGFGCENCKLYFIKKNTVISPSPLNQDAIYNPLSLAIGDSGIIDEEQWTVTGYSKQRTSNERYWETYYLVNSSDEERLLNVYNGNWEWAKACNTINLSFTTDSSVTLTEGTYRLYTDEYFKSIYVLGFLKQDVAHSPRLSKDFICPPYAMLIEMNPKGTYQYQARSITQEELIKAFPNIVLPDIYNLNRLELLFGSLRESLGIAAITLLILCGLSLMQTPKTLISEQYLNLQVNKDTTIRTQTFELPQSVQMMTIDLYAGVTNSRVDANITLLNAETMEVSHVYDRIAYREGVKGITAWSRGDRNSTIKFCELPRGKYWLELHFRAKAPTIMTYSVMAGGRSTWIFYYALASLLGITILAVYVYLNRWEDSTVAPFDLLPISTIKY